MTTGERWHVTPGYDVRTVEGDRFVASVFGPSEKKELKMQRAQLVAAAPELLEALEGLVKQIEAGRFVDLPFQAHQARDVIALARGERP